MAPINLDLRCVSTQHPAPNGAWGKTRLESRIKGFTQISFMVALLGAGPTRAFVAGSGQWFWHNANPSPAWTAVQ